MIQIASVSNLSDIKHNNSYKRRTNTSYSFLFFKLVIILALVSIAHLSHAAEVTLTWDSNDQASGYILHYGLESRAYGSSVDVGNNIKHTITNLGDNEIYYFAVTAYNEFAESDYSDELSFNTAVSTVNEPPTAAAGEDQSVSAFDIVILDGSYSSDPDDGIATFLWEQIEGIPIELSDSSAIGPNFTCPEIGSNSDTLTFRLIVTDYSGVTDSDTVKIYVNDAAETPQNNQGADYCESASLITHSLGIGNFTLGNFSNSSAADGYSNFTSKVIYIEKAKPYLISLSAEPENTIEIQYWRVWADLNRDGDFDDSGEKLYESSGSDTISGQIVFPAGASDGNTRLRISMGLFDYPKPCGNIYYGEVEDYTLVINETSSISNEEVSITDPVPSILGNDSAGQLSVRTGTAISIKVELDPAEYSGKNADWWVLAKTPTGEWYYFDYPFSQWRYAGSLDNISTSYQGALGYLATLELHNLDTSNLAPGGYIFYFAVDLLMDGLLDVDAWYYDSVNINLMP